MVQKRGTLEESSTTKKPEDFGMVLLFLFASFESVQNTFKDYSKTIQIDWNNSYICLMKTILLYMISLMPLLSMGQEIERKALGYSINGVEVVRRYWPSAVARKPSEVSGIVLYSDSVGPCRQTMCLLIRFYEETASDGSVYVEFVYEDGEKERVPMLRDKRSVYCFIERSRSAYDKSLCSIYVGGIGEIVVGPESVRGFARAVAIR